MSVKFNIVHNTPSDWIKAATAALTAGAMTYGVAVSNSNGVTLMEWVGVLVAGVTAFLTVLGVYSAEEPQTVPDNLEPVTFQPDNAAAADAADIEEAPQHGSSSQG